MSPINSYDEVLLVVDQDQRFKDAQSRRKKIDPDREAETINTLVKVLGRRPIRYALVSEHDERGLKAYHRMGFEVVQVKDSRAADVNRFIAQHSEVLKNGHFSHLVLVTTDSTFAFLANQVDPRTTRISVWAPLGSINPEMTSTMPPCEFRDLDEMLPASPKVAVLVDFENIWYGLKKLGFKPTPKVVMDAIRSVGNEFGEIKKLTAYADWDLMGKENQGNIQRELVQQDVETQYLINMRGKNTADMKIANDIRDMVERGSTTREEVDVIVLATGDRDFRDIVKTAKERGKRVIVLAVHNGVSRELINVASEVRYIDDLLKPPPPPAKKVAREYELEIALLAKESKPWIALSEIPNLGIQNPEEFTKRATTLGLVKLEQRSNDENEPIDGLRLNHENALVKVVTRLAHWAPDRIRFCLKQRGMPYVDSAFLARGMTMDTNFQEWGVGQERHDADHWLHLLCMAGILQKKTQPNPKSPNRDITTWWLPEAPKAEDQAYNQRQVRQAATTGSEPWPTSAPSDAEDGRKENTQDKSQPGNVWKTLLGAPV